MVEVSIEGHLRGTTQSPVGQSPGIATGRATMFGVMFARHQNHFPFLVLGRCALRRLSERRIRLDRGGFLRPHHHNFFGGSLMSTPLAEAP
jgi:hypothetical protein